ncbi:leucyl aminopeptidase [Spirosoma taeanense]|uniref:Probable cytosol aminopeptidase n=1 Tax=Spirosoma taeanense TaxID=2735870 RepID=A0A6M5Y6K5_9BACT|nr:leucyl aminopeptidase [Spirosoma taeanense]QJW90048.1 leucyl aminopeptidase [Spirosoma taeanense]
MIISLQTHSSPADVLIIPVAQTDGLLEQLARLADSVGLPTRVLQADFKAEPNELFSQYQPDGSRVFLLGLGKEPGSLDWLRTFRKLFFTQKTKLPLAVTIDLTGFAGAVAESVVLGVLGGGYDLRLYQTDKTDLSAFYAEEGRLTVLTTPAEQETAQAALMRGEVLAQTQRQMLDLMNAPANYKNPQTLADWALTSGQAHGYKVTVLDADALAEQGLGALLSVARGSEVAPVLIIAEYTPQPDDPSAQPAWPRVGLVGKGVTFDTGGISIKTSANMHLMKSDMGGGAAVLGTIEVAARLKLPVHLIGIVPATENSVDGRSTKPGDVVTAYSGKTIEIIDTDAEGRVILADGLGYMIRNFQPDVLIDLATLTGSVIAALGYHAAGLFTQNDELAAQLITAANETGERLWRMPLWDAYKEDIKSDVADVKNFSGKPLAGSISAAKFLEVFAEGHPAWAHLDIAGMAFADTEFGQQKNATGFGIRLLVDYLRRLSAKHSETKSGY